MAAYLRPHGAVGGRACSVGVRVGVGVGVSLTRLKEAQAARSSPWDGVCTTLRIS